MQDKYVADIGDFGKYALLNHLRKASALRLGVIWYWVDPDHTDRAHQKNDGKHTAYLGLNGKMPNMDLQTIEPDLFSQLRSIVHENRRNIQSVQNDFILGPDTVYFADSVSSHAPTKTRDPWLKSALKSVEDVGIVFLDPDNGLASSNRNGRRREDAKYVLRSDLKAFWSNGKRIIVLYHHPNRKNKKVDHDMQIENLAKEIESALGHSCVLPLRYRRGTSRAYFIIVPETDAVHWKQSLCAFVERWPVKNSVRAFERKFG